MQVIWNELLIVLAVIALIAIVVEATNMAVKCWREWRGVKDDEK